MPIKRIAVLGAAAIAAMVGPAAAMSGLVGPEFDDFKPRAPKARKRPPTEKGESWRDREARLNSKFHAAQRGKKRK